MYRVQPLYYFFSLSADSPSFKSSWPEKMAGATVFHTDPQLSSSVAITPYPPLSFSLSIFAGISDAANDLPLPSLGASSFFLFFSFRGSVEVLREKFNLETGEIAGKKGGRGTLSLSGI